MARFDIVLPVSSKDRKTSYFDLYGQSVLRYTSVEIRYLDKLAEQLIEVSPVSNLPLQRKKSREGQRKSRGLIVDICEKLGFIWQSSEEIREIQSKTELIDGTQ